MIHYVRHVYYYVFIIISVDLVKRKGLGELVGLIDKNW